MLAMASCTIGFRDEAAQLKITLENSEAIREDTIKRADELEKKLEAAEKALEEARTKATSEEKRWEEEKSKMATHEADIRQRLDTLHYGRSWLCRAAILHGKGLICTAKIRWQRLSQQMIFAVRFGKYAWQRILPCGRSLPCARRLCREALRCRAPDVLCRVNWTHGEEV
nr:uncharacterized protein LOC127348441 [Lolium perenne]